MGRISALTELTSLASDDYLVVLDSSANIAKKISVANAFGIPDFGWTAAGESWTYSAYSATTRIAEITVPTDATTKYQAGMRVRFSQTTDGVKYGIIHKVEATKLHVFMKSGNDFDNEAITSPSYSTVKVPFGFDASPTMWERLATDTTQRSQASPVSGTWYNMGSFSLSLGVGAWDLSYRVTRQHNSGVASAKIYSALSSANNSESDSELSAAAELANTSATIAGVSWSLYARKVVLLSSATTYYANTKTTVASGTIYARGDDAKETIRAISAYL